MGTQINGDFIGFSFGGVSSSKLGIVRVSDGSRYNENLLPTIQDKTVQVPGGDGTYYFGSYYTQRPFNISIAYDSLTEDQVREIKKTFGNKKPQKLIFDESPYKFYWAKCTGTSSLKFICFSDPQDGEDLQKGRLYKGEGTLSFTCYDPFGYSVSRWVKGINNLTDLNAWREASGLLGDGTELSNPWVCEDKNATLINANGAATKTFSVENNGDMETDWRMTVDNISGNSGVLGLTIEAKDNLDQLVGKLEFSNLELEPGDVKVKIDSKLNLIRGASKDLNTNNIYNQYITKGAFFKLPVGTTKFTITPNENTHVGVIKFHYKYY